MAAPRSFFCEAEIKKMEKIKEGIEIVRKATEEDARGNNGDAIVLYESSLVLFNLALEGNFPVIQSLFLFKQPSLETSRR